MKNNGFTLVELIITIALIAVMSVTVGVSMSGMLNRQTEKSLEEYQNKIAKAACTYAEIKNDWKDDGATTTIKISEILKMGLLKKDFQNPCSGRPIIDYKDAVVTVKYNGGERTCEYKYTPSADDEDKCNIKK